MDKKLEFNEALSALVEFATVNGNVITSADIKAHFKEIIDDEAKYEAIYKYLISQKIKISDIDEDTETVDATLPNAAETEEGKAFLDMYYNEVNELALDENIDVNALIEASKNGDKEAINKLTELHLPLVMDIAKEFKSSPLRESDLIGTGNVALFEAIVSYDGTATDYKEYLSDYIKKSIKDAEEEEISSVRTFNHAANRANALSDATIELAKELEREATLEELCEKLSLSEEEVRNVMKMSLEAINKNPTEE
ncbi:MAG: hypothetical protein J6L69_04130 [Lachnospiraceae bacterium]|nr:hypothetical protein [Lachnospiraceae bacterium]